MAQITPTQRNALKWLHERNGSGVIDKVGRVIAAGEIVGLYSGGELAEAIHSVTWLRLCSQGLIEPDGPNRLRISEAGRAIIGGSP